MSDAPDPLLLDHEADGIRELDNQLPRWWVWLFNLTILFALCYLGFYHVWAKGDLMLAEYQREMEIGDAIKAKALAQFEADLATLVPLEDEPALAQGGQIFAQMCAPCHRGDGGGLVGPNLTDDYWIHGAAFKDNLRTIYHGVPDKGMVSWKNLLKPREVLAVGSYIYTLRGTQPPKPKPPENQAPANVPNIYE
ncbi:MAG: c-type cytochrome [Verrucomicrobia bacterium]|nr:c-type cytochrome [Verrucomicrobiota bacterium]